MGLFKGKFKKFLTELYTLIRVKKNVHAIESLCLFHLILKKIRPCHAKTCLWAYADSEGPDRLSLSDNRIIGYYRIYELRTKPMLNFEHVQNDLNLLICAWLKALFHLMWPINVLVNPL